MDNARFLDPIVFGEYPSEMQEILGTTLPVFTNHNLKIMKNGVDFIGINYYSGFYAKDCMYSACEPGPGITKTEGLALRIAQKHGVFLGEPVSYLNPTNYHFDIQIYLNFESMITS